MNVTVSEKRKRVYKRKFDWDAARDWYAQGVTIKDIAARCGVSEAAVARVVVPGRKERMEARSLAFQRATCQICGGPASFNPARNESREAVRCPVCAGKERRTSVRFDEMGYLAAVKCVVCKKWQAPESFGRGTRFRDLRDGGIHNNCRACATKLRQAYRERHKVPCTRCGRPALAQSERKRYDRPIRPTTLCVTCWRETNLDRIREHAFAARRQAA